MGGGGRNILGICLTRFNRISMHENGVSYTFLVITDYYTFKCNNKQYKNNNKTMSYVAAVVITVYTDIRTGDVFNIL